jgi:glycosyltransferase involved in cell wall biosynthesis
MIRGEPGLGFQADGLREPRPAAPARVAPPRAARFVPKTVALVAPSFASIAVAAGSLINELGHQGHRVVCFAPSMKETAAAEALNRHHAEVRGIRALNGGVFPLAEPIALFQLVNAFREIGPDVVAGFSPKSAALAGIAGRMAGVPHIVSMIGELGRGFEEAPDRVSPVSRTLRSTLLRLVFRLSHTAVFLNEENLKLLQLHHLVPDRLRQFPTNGSGIDLRYFPQAPLPPFDRGALFLYAGPLDRRLGIEEFCKAARQLQAKRGNYKCLVVGPEIHGPNGFPLRELKRYRDVIQYLGPQADPRPYLARTHVFVLPARGDVIPQALIEAVAMGRPVITSTSRGCRVAVREGGNGMIVPPGDASALAGAMARLLLRPDLIPAMARASRELAENQFDSRRVNARMLEALDL